jgi:hypothetical protein
MPLDFHFFADFQGTRGSLRNAPQDRQDGLTGKEPATLQVNFIL